MEAAAIALHGVDESRRTITHRESRSMRNVNAKWGMFRLARLGRRDSVLLRMW